MDAGGAGPQPVAASAARSVDTCDAPFCGLPKQNFWITLINFDIALMRTHFDLFNRSVKHTGKLNERDGCQGSCESCSQLLWNA